MTINNLKSTALLRRSRASILRAKAKAYAEQAPHLTKDQERILRGLAACLALDAEHEDGQAERLERLAAGEDLELGAESAGGDAATFERRVC